MLHGIFLANLLCAVFMGGFVGWSGFLLERVRKELQTVPPSGGKPIVPPRLPRSIRQGLRHTTGYPLDLLGEHAKFFPKSKQPSHVGIAVAGILLSFSGVVLTQHSRVTVRTRLAAIVQSFGYGRLGRIVTLH